jgi:hypothetical protein
VACRRKETKVNDACCALYITALVADVLELETILLHVWMHIHTYHSGYPTISYYYIWVQDRTPIWFEHLCHIKLV